MGKTGLLILMIMALLLVGLLAYRMADALVLSIFAYRTPLKGYPPLTHDVTDPITQQVVVVVVDGLRHDTSLEMPTLKALRSVGADALLVFPPPSSTQTALTTLVTGVGPETNDAPLVDRAVELIQPIRLDTVFGSVGRAGLTAGIAGLRWWERLVPPEGLYVHAYVDSSSDEGDSEVVEKAVSFVREFAPNLLFIHLRQVEEAGRVYGATSSAYQEAALRCDAYIQRVASAMDLSRSVLMILASHGQLDDGTHGGAEVSARLTPFVMVGQGIAPGSYRAISAMDVATLVSALLGSPVPAHAQGSIPSKMLKMSDEQAATKLLALAAQRLRIGNMYLASIGRGAVSKTAEGDRLTAQSSLLVGNVTSAAELAELAVKQTDLEMVRGRLARLYSERNQRLPAFAAALLSPPLALWLKRGRRTLWIALASCVSLEVYHLLYLRQGNLYSFSTIPPGALASNLLGNLHNAILAMAVGAVIVLWGSWRQRERSAYEVAKATYSVALVSLVLIAQGVACCVTWSGVAFRWYIPNLTVAYVQYFLLEQAMWFALVGLGLPIPAVLAQPALLALGDWHQRRTNRLHKPRQQEA